MYLFASDGPGNETQEDPVWMERLIEFAGTNLFWVSLWFAILILLLWNLFGHVMSGVRLVDPTEVTRLMNHEHAVVIDVRNRDDFDRGHILNAVNIPEPELPDKKQELEKFKKKPLILYCQNGSVSPRLARRLMAEGFPGVLCMKGGISTWQGASLPLTRNQHPERGKK